MCKDANIMHYAGHVRVSGSFQTEQRESKTAAGVTTTTDAQLSISSHAGNPALQGRYDKLAWPLRTFPRRLNGRQYVRNSRAKPDEETNGRNEATEIRLQTDSVQPLCVFTWAHETMRYVIMRAKLLDVRFAQGSRGTNRTPTRHCTRTHRLATPTYWKLKLPNALPKPPCCCCCCGWPNGAPCCIGC